MIPNFENCNYLLSVNYWSKYGILCNSYTTVAMIYHPETQGHSLRRGHGYQQQIMAAMVQVLYIPDWPK